MKKHFLIPYFLFLISILSLPENLFSQQSPVEVYPSNWWTGMNWNKVQVMMHGDKMAEKFPMIKMGPNEIKLATDLKYFPLDARTSGVYELMK